MPRKARPARGFHPSLFLGKVGAGKTVREYRSKAVVYAQGDVADAVYYVESGKVKLTVVSTRGREAASTTTAASRSTTRCSPSSCATEARASPSL